MTCTRRKTQSFSLTHFSSFVLPFTSCVRIEWPQGKSSWPSGGTLGEWLSISESISLSVPWRKTTHLFPELVVTIKCGRHYIWKDSTGLNQHSSFPWMLVLCHLQTWLVGYSQGRKLPLTSTDSSNYYFNEMMTIQLPRSNERLTDHNFKMGGGKHTLI